MQKYTKFFNNIAELLETGLVSSKDLKEELENSLKFTAEKIIKKLKLVSRIYVLAIIIQYGVVIIS